MFSFTDKKRSRERFEVIYGTSHTIQSLKNLTNKIVKGLKGGWTENIWVDLLKEMELQNSHATVRLNSIRILLNLTTGISSNYLYTQNFQAYFSPSFLPH